MSTRQIFLVLSLFLPTIGCGHPASKAECEEIFRRSAEIELRKRNITDAKQIASRVREAREARGDSVKNCVGKRITQSAMECVRSAKTSEELDGCLD